MTAFGILAHDDPHLLRRLVRRLGPHRVIVHIDGKRDLSPFAVALHDLAHVELVTQGRVPTNWGGWSQVEATLRIYRQFLEGADASEQIVLLSGHCYPVHSIESIVGRLHNPARPLRIKATPYALVGDQRRSQGLHIFDALPTKAGPLRRVPYGIARRIVTSATGAAGLGERRIDDLYLGSQWTVLTAEVIRESILPASAELRPRLRHMFAPEEVFFPTAVYNSHISHLSQGPPEYLGDEVSQYANIHLLDPAMAKIFIDADLPEIHASGKEFVRKVASDASRQLLDHLDAAALSGGDAQ